MVEYEVAIEVDPAVADDYRDWLRGHVARMLALPGFVEATVLAVDDPPAAAPGWIGLCVRYRLHDAAALSHYFAEHAANMRAEGVARFGDRFTARRRVLTPLPGAS